MMFEITNWGWPQYTFMVLFFLNLAIHAAMDGRPKVGVYSFPLGFVGTIISFTILLFGGFWA